MARKPKQNRPARAAAKRKPGRPRKQGRAAGQDTAFALADAPRNGKPSSNVLSGYRPKYQQRAGLFTEVSFTDPLASILSSLFPYNPDELVGKRGLEIFDKMRRDDQVHAALRIKKLGVLAPGWQVTAPDGSEDTPDMDERVDFIRSCLSTVGDTEDSIGSTFEYDIEEILTALEYGFSITEKIFRVIGGGPFAGKIGLKALKTRKPHSFDFEVDQHGNLLPEGIRQSTPSGYQSYAPGKFVLYTYDPEFDNPYGKSDLVNVYREWFSKDTVHKFWTIWLERYGEPLADAEYDETIGPEDQNVIEDVLKNLSSRNYFIHPKGVTLNLREPGSSGRGAGGVAAYQAAIQAWNLAIARGIMIPKHLGLTEGGEVGTLAQAKENAKIFAIVLHALRGDIAHRVVQRQIVRPLMRLNFDPPEPMPVFQFNPLTSEEALELAGKFLEAAEKGIVISSREDESHFRKLTQFPERTEGDEPDGPAGKENPEGPDKPKDMPEPEDREDFQARLSLAFIRADGACAHGVHAHAMDKFDLLRAPDGWIEKRFGFRNVATELNGIAEAAHETMVKELTALKDSVKLAVGRMYKPFPKPSDARKFTIPSAPVSRLRKEVERFTLDGFERGRAQARRVISKRKQMANPMLLTPEAALRVFKDRAFWVTGIISDDLTNGIKGILYNAMLSGATQQETEEQIARLFDKYASTPELAGSVTEEAMSAARVENAIRTNLMTAYNQGALSEYREAAKEGLVEAVQFSAILDDRTTEVCGFLGTKKTILPINHPDVGSITPPLHYQCRSILIPVLAGDDWAASSQKEINKGKELADPRFIA